MIYLTNGRWAVIPGNIDSIFIALNGKKSLCIKTKAGVCFEDNKREISLIQDGNVITSVKLNFKDVEKESERVQLLDEYFEKLTEMYLLGLTEI